MKVRVSSGNCTDDWKSSAAPSPAQEPGLRAGGADTYSSAGTNQQAELAAGGGASYRGRGTCSSATGVQERSLLRCSLNLPLNTCSISAMKKTHTAEPGMLGNGGGAWGQSADTT